MRRIADAAEFRPNVARTFGLTAGERLVEYMRSPLPVGSFYSDVAALQALGDWGVFSRDRGRVPVPGPSDPEARSSSGSTCKAASRVLLQLNTSPEVPKITSQIQGQVEQVIDSRINGLRRRRTTDHDGRQRPHPRRAAEREESRRSGPLAQRGREARLQDHAAGGQRARERDKKYADDPNGAYKDSGPIVYTGAELRAAQSAPEPERHRLADQLPDEESRQSSAR